MRNIFRFHFLHQKYYNKSVTKKDTIPMILCKVSEGHIPSKKGHVRQKRNPSLIIMQLLSQKRKLMKTYLFTINTNTENSYADLQPVGGWIKYTNVGLWSNTNTASMRKPHFLRYFHIPWVKIKQSKKMQVIVNTWLNAQLVKWKVYRRLLVYPELWYKVLQVFRLLDILSLNLRIGWPTIISCWVQPRNKNS